MKKYFKNRMEVLRNKALSKWHDLTILFSFYRYKVKGKVIKKDIPNVVIAWSIIGIIGLSLIFYSQSFGKESTKFLSNKPVFANISSLIYKISWEKKFKMKELEDEVQLSRLEEERAKTEAQKSQEAQEEAEQKTQEEMNKRASAEAAKRSADQKAKVADQKAQEEEGKRKQEELARQVAEQEILSKEVEEEKMNSDFDGDGLTYRQELDQGTLDTNSDSDGDGIRDDKDLNPSGGGRKIAQDFEWNYEFDNTVWNATFSVHEDWYEYYKNKSRPPQGVSYITEHDDFIQDVAEKLEYNANLEGYNKAVFAYSFVQSLPYVKDAYTSFNEYPKYPVETFVERNGDCEDTSYLTASILEAMDLDAVLVLFTNHMAVAVWTNPKQSGTYYELNGRRYYYLETTGEGWDLGEMPPEYSNTPGALIEIPSGKTTHVYPQYESPCYSSSEFSGYYTDGENTYSNSQCNHLANCIFYEDFYINPQTLSFYHNSSCSQIAVEGCYKSENYPGYFYDDIDIYYYDSRCIQTAKICRLSSVYSDRYWDGYDFYWNSSCTQKVVSWCVKSTYQPGYFYNGVNWYYDYQCTQVADF